MIVIFYKCACLSEERSVAVPARDDPESDPAHYVKNIIGQAIFDDHAVISPQCNSTKMQYVKIPLSGDWIGQQPQRH